MEHSSKIWIRVVNRLDGKNVMFWSSKTDILQANTHDLIIKIYDQIEFSITSQMALKQALEIFSDEWDTWTFGIPAPIVDFIDSEQYKSELTALRNFA